MLREYVLGLEAHSYIRGELALGRHLGSALLRLPIESGRAFTFLPPNVSPGDLHDFGSGGVASGEENRRLALLVSAYLTTSHTGTPIGVFEHALARKQDSRKPTFPYFTVEDSVYVAIRRGASIQQIADWAREVHAYPSIGVLSSPEGKALRIEHDSEQSPATLEAIADAADVVLIGAYDTEAWVYWTRG